MTSINTSANYYPLTNQQSGASNNSAANPTLSLLNALQGSPGNSASTNSDSYILNLSPAAQQLLSGNTSSSTSGNGNGNFILSSAEQKAVTAILAKYATAPQTQDTFNKIQDDLKAAGLDPNTLAQKDKINSFNPTETLINALNGNNPDLLNNQNSSTDSTEQTKSSNYLQNIVKQWQNLSQASSTSSSSAV
jgi:hypothetical protein